MARTSNYNIILFNNKTMPRNKWGNFSRKRDIEVIALFRLRGVEI